MEGVVNVYQRETNTASVELKEENKVRQLEMDTELKDQIREHLQKQGYEITEEAKFLGKSGIEHVFDMLAHRDDGFTGYTVAICIAAGGDREAEVSTIFNFANKAYDTGISNRILIAVPEFSEEVKQLAQSSGYRSLMGNE